MGCTREKIVEAVIKRFPSTLSTESLNKVKAIAMDLASKAVVETPMIHQPSEVLTRLGNKISSAGTTIKSKYDGVIKGLEEVANGYKKYIDTSSTFDKNKHIWGNRGQYSYFGNPFYGVGTDATVNTKDNKVLSAMYYEWLENGSVPDGYTGDLKELNSYRNKVTSEAAIKQMREVFNDNKTVWYSGTAKHENISHVVALLKYMESKIDNSKKAEISTTTASNSNVINLVKLANGAIVNGANKNASTVKVNSIEELAELSVQLDGLMSGHKDSATVNRWVTRFKELGIQTTFKPISVTLVNGLVKGKDLAVAYGNNSIHINTDYSKYKNEKDKYGESKPLPLRIVLHEYVHTITQNALADKNNETVKKMVALYDRVKGHSSLKGERGVVNVAEFVAEAIANDRFKEKLDRIAGENKIVNKIKELFKELLKGLIGTKSEAITALDEVLDLAHTLIQENNNYSNSGIRNSYRQENLSKGTKLYHVSDTKFEKLAANGDAVVDKKGNPWTFSPIGVHVGTLDTVSNYNSQMQGNLKHMYEIEPTEDIKTLRMQDPGDGDWTADNMYEQLLEMFGKPTFDKDADNSEVVKYLKDKGYGAIVYENTEESGESYIVINPNKFKVVYKENKGIIHPKESTANKLVEAAKGCAK